MKWFKHESDDRNKIVSKLIRSKFGAEGYGIFQALKEIIAEYVEQENYSEWGMVHPLHTIETLSEECSATPEKLREFLSFCNEKGIIERKSERLFYQDMLSRLDDFAARIKRLQKPTTKSVRSKYDIKENKIKENKVKEKKIENTISYLSNIPENDLEEFNKKYEVSISDIKKLAAQLVLWCETNEETKKNYRSFIQNRLLDKYGFKKIIPNLHPDLSDTEPLSDEKMAKFRSQMKNIGKPMAK